MKDELIKGHAAAFFTAILWGTTFISTKVLLRDFAPVEILFIRFLLGLMALFIAYPKRFKSRSVREEAIFALAGLTGICLYYLLENIALTFTMASNVSVVVAVAPFFTAILSRIMIDRSERLGAGFFLGFILSMAGIAIISFSGSELKLNPFGDLLALLAAVTWACYSVLTKKISSFVYNTLLTTRRIFCYGIIFMIPVLRFMDFSPDISSLTKPINLANLLFLGLGASAACFVTWNYAVKLLGAVRTSVYIYLVPVITVIASILILKEPFTFMTGLGTLLTLSGLICSEIKAGIRHKNKES